MFRWLCSPLFATANTIVFIHHLRRFLPSPYRIVWGVGCYVLSSTWPPYVAASMQVLILLRPSFLPFLPPPSPSLLSFQLRRAESGWIIVSYRLSRILRALAGSVHCITIAILLVLWLIPRIARTELSLWYLVSIHRKKEGREVVLRLEFASRDFIERVRTLTMIPHRYC